MPIPSLEWSKNIDMIIKIPTIRLPVQVGVVGVAPLHSSMAGGTAAAAAVANNLSSATITLRGVDRILSLNWKLWPMNQYQFHHLMLWQDAATKQTFYPKLVTQETVLPGILQAYGGKMPSAGFLLGGLHFGVALQTDTEHTTQVDLWETVIGMESFIDTTTTTTTTNNNTIQVPLHKHKDCRGHLLLQVQVTLPLLGMQQENITDKSWSKIIPPDDPTWPVLVTETSVPLVGRICGGNMDSWCALKVC